MADAQAVIFDLLAGRWRSQALYTGVELGIFEALDRAPKCAGTIAQELGLDSELSYRLLRGLGSIGLVDEHAQRFFSITPAGELLRTDHPQSLRATVLLREGPEHYAVWKHLPSMVRDGHQDGFVREFGCTAFAYAERVPEYAASFDAAMSSYSSVQTAWALEVLESRNLERYSHLCDIGGGHGHLLAHFLVRYPNATGSILERSQVFDDPGALWAQRLGVSDRCRYVVGDMFIDVPPADAYVLKMVLHNWNDDQCVQILRTAHKRASPGRVFIIEHVVPGFETPHFSKLFDLHMMCWGTGRERTAHEYAVLLERAGWTYAGSWPSAAGQIGVIEGTKP